MRHTWVVGVSYTVLKILGFLHNLGSAHQESVSQTLLLRNHALPIPSKHLDRRVSVLRGWAKGGKPVIGRRAKVMPLYVVDRLTEIVHALLYPVCADAEDQDDGEVQL
jgi:hypothetical protein